MTQSRTQNILMPMNITSIVVLVLARHQKISLNETLTGRVIKNNNKTEPASNSHSPVATWSQNERMKIAKQITDPLLAERFVNTLFCIFFFTSMLERNLKRKAQLSQNQYWGKNFSYHWQPIVMDQPFVMSCIRHDLFLSFKLVFYTLSKS